MKPIGLDSHQQKTLVRKVLSLIERDPLIEYFKMRIEKTPRGTCVSVTGQRAEKEFAARAEGPNFIEVVNELRDRIVEQLPKRPDGRWIEETMWPPATI